MRFEKLYVVFGGMSWNSGVLEKFYMALWLGHI